MREWGFSVWLGEFAGAWQMGDGARLDGLFYCGFGLVFLSSLLGLVLLAFGDEAEFVPCVCERCGSVWWFV